MSHRWGREGSTDILGTKRHSMVKLVWETLMQQWTGLLEHNNTADRTQIRILKYHFMVRTLTTCWFLISLFTSISLQSTQYWTAEEHFITTWTAYFRDWYLWFCARIPMDECQTAGWHNNLFMNHNVSGKSHHAIILISNKTLSCVQIIFIVITALLSITMTYRWKSRCILLDFTCIRQLVANWTT